MKTIRRPKSRNKAWIYTWILIGILLIAAVIKFGGSAVAAPFMRAGTAVHGAGAAALGIFSSKTSVEEENEKLKNELAQLQVAIERDKLLEQENADLKQLLGRHSRNSSILAAVISKPPFSLYDTVVVDVGSSDQVSEGDLVLALGLVPIGTVATVYPNTATIKLFSSSGQNVEVRIAKNVEATAEAQGGGNFLIKLPKGTAVAVGDTISAPGIGAQIFGTVENIETTENEPFIYVRFSLPVNMSELHFLQIDRAAVSI